MNNIIYFGNDWFAENKTSSHHISERLARNNRILYIECPGLRAPKGTGRDVKKLFSKVFKSLRGPRKINDNLYIYTLFQLPFHKYAAVRWINTLLVLLSVNLLKFFLKLKNPILWFVVPHLYMVPDNIKSLCKVYYCIDDYAGIPDVDINAVEEMDRQMTIKADIVFLASDTLYEQKKALNDNVHLSPHGVDFDHFNRVHQNDTIIPDDISAIKKPVIGCFGLIDERIDLELIRHMAEKKADWNFIFIGRLDVDQNPCEGLANVHFIGRRPYAELPNYAALFDVTLMPYKPEHRMNINCNPLKLREYLSTGLPVVSARIPQVEQYTDVIQIEDSPKGFINAIEKAINEDKSLHIKNRLDRVKECTWDARVEKVISLVQDSIEQSRQRKDSRFTQA